MIPWRVHGEHHKHIKDTETEFFDPREDPDKKTSIVVKVSYNRAEDVQRYFRWNFLTPQDNVTSWKLQPGNKAKSNQHRFHSRVALTLGSERTPPKYRSKARWDLHMDAVQSQLMFWTQWIHNLECTKEEASLKAKQEKKDEKDEIMTLYDEPLKLLEAEKDSTAIELRALIEYRPHVQAHEEFDMTCDVIKAKTYCYFCATLEHSFSDCDARGCTICGEKDHPHYKCSKQCDCKMRPPHVKAECPQKAVSKGQQSEVVSLRRLQKNQQSSQPISESPVVSEDTDTDKSSEKSDDRKHRAADASGKDISMEISEKTVAGDIFAKGDFGNERDPFVDARLSDLHKSLQRSLGL